MKSTSRSSRLSTQKHLTKKKKKDTVYVEKIPSVIIEHLAILKGIRVNNNVTHPKIKIIFQNPRYPQLDGNLTHKQGESQTDTNITTKEDSSQIRSTAGQWHDHRLPPPRPTGPLLPPASPALHPRPGKTTKVHQTATQGTTILLRHHADEMQMPTTETCTKCRTSAPSVTTMPNKGSHNLNNAGHSRPKTQWPPSTNR